MVSTDEVKYLGWLSKLELTDEEITKYQAQIDGIVSYLDKLDTLQLADSESTNLEKDVSELRDDHSQTFTGEILKSANKVKDGFIKGPRMRQNV
jgi:aspartyl-tRNA(Asn)/glutamyl-tRNA(Gln) amidotransferase subunit C